MSADPHPPPPTREPSRPGCRSCEPSREEARESSRRSFLGWLGATAAGASAAGLLSGCQPHRLQEVSPEKLKEYLERLEARQRKRLNQEIQVDGTPPMPGVEFAYALDLSRCIGCRRCVYACVEENNQSRDPQIHWIRVLEMEKRHGIDLSHADAYYDPPQVPREGHFYVPMACQQCENPPCTKVCPVGATWSEPDGIVVIDYDWCIGCRYCMAACPYGARRFNWAEPSIPEENLNPRTHVLGNVPRLKGVVEKCTFCIQRTRQGQYPACVEICPVGARKFGNLLDPESEVRYVIEHKRVLILKEELNTVPRFFFFYGV